MHLCKVKICGITNLDDALAAVDMGADLIGFNFYPPSPRCVDADRALKIINRIPTFVDTCGIFVNPTVDQISRIEEIGCLNWVQLHGDETPEFCDSLSWLSARTIKALRIRTPDDIGKAEGYYTHAVLLDAFHPDLYGGSGTAFDWSWLNGLDKRVFLAGGITPENAAAAVETGAYGIDLCSGVESAPGKKDHAKMKRLFDNIRHVRH